jgi:hypothetical protein
VVVFFGGGGARSEKWEEGVRFCVFCAFCGFRRIGEEEDDDEKEEEEEEDWDEDY